VAIARLHRQEISWGLLSKLGEGFVEAFYATLIGSPYGFAFVTELEGQVVGFASGVVDWRPFYRFFMRRRWLLAPRVLASSLLRRRWMRLIETSRYTTMSSLPPAELVSIALAHEARGGGVGMELVHRVLNEFSARGITAVRVTAGRANERARRLYERAGFRLDSEMEIHPGEREPVYVITLPQS